MPRDEIVVAGESFATKKALKGKLKAMLHSSPLGEELDEPEHSFLLCVLFRHPEVLKKIGPGVRAFRVVTSEFRNRCFEVIRVDGSLSNFSYMKCARGDAGD